MRMDEATVISWIETMCRLGYANNAEFDSNSGAHKLGHRKIRDKLPGKAGGN